MLLGSGRTSSSSEPSESDYVAELDKQSKKLLDGYDISSTQRAKLLQDAVLSRLLVTDCILRMWLTRCCLSVR